MVSMSIISCATGTDLSAWLIAVSVVVVLLVLLVILVVIGICTCVVIRLGRKKVISNCNKKGMVLVLIIIIDTYINRCDT